MTQSISTNTFGVAKWVVSADPTQGNFTTIGAALTAASANDVVYIRDGTYTENDTAKAGVSLVGESMQNTIILGTLTFSATGTYRLQNLTLQTNSANVIAMSSANVIQLFGQNIYFNCPNFTGISNTNSNAASVLSLQSCQYTTASTFALFSSSSAGVLEFLSTYGLNNLSASSQANTISNALNVRMADCRLTEPLTCSSGVVEIKNTEIDVSNVNSTALTVSGATVTSFNSVYLSGTASAINVSSGTFNSYGDTAGSSNTNAVTGAGTINYNNMKFSGTSSLINTTTQTGGQVAAGKNGNAIASGFVGQTIRAATASPGTSVPSSTNTVNMNAGITLTAGTWDITFQGQWTGTLQTKNIIGISTNTGSFTGTVPGDSRADSGLSATAASDSFMTVAAFGVVVSTPTTYFPVAQSTFTGTASIYGRISARCVG